MGLRDLLLGEIYLDHYLTCSPLDKAAGRSSSSSTCSQRKVKDTLEDLPYRLSRRDEDEYISLRVFRVFATCTVTNLFPRLGGTC
jgi:hypothetical protein